jgi:hypothetical protein
LGFIPLFTILKFDTFKIFCQVLQVSEIQTSTREEILAKIQNFSEKSENFGIFLLLPGVLHYLLLKKASFLVNIYMWEKGSTLLYNFWADK